MHQISLIKEKKKKDKKQYPCFNANHYYCPNTDPIDFIDCSHNIFFLYLNLSYRSNNGRSIAPLNDPPKRIKPPPQTQASKPRQPLLHPLPHRRSSLILKHNRRASADSPLLRSRMGKHWLIKCCVCKTFAPLLKAFYEEVNLEEKRLEIIYVGFDKVKKDY